MDGLPIDAQILGIDMNPAALKKAKDAVYSAWSLRSTPGHIKDRWFVPKDQGFRLRPEIQSMVTFEQQNLLTDDPAFFRAGSFDIVFCRNVTIYFSDAATRKVASKLEQAIVPGGYLFLGHSETLRGISNEFELLHTHETFYYQRKDPTRFSAADAGRPSSDRPSSDRPPSDRPSSDRPSSDRPKTQGDAISGFDAETWMSAIQRSGARIEAIARQLEESPLREATTPQARRREAHELFQAERFNEALAVLKAMRSDAQGDLEVELLTAVIYFNQGLFPEAEKICVSAIGAGDGGAAAHYLLGLCREHEGNRTRAMHHYRSSIRLDSTFAMPHLRLGQLCRRASDLESARAEMRLATELVARERPDRIALFGGGFHRNALLELCRAELQACEEAP